MAFWDGRLFFTLDFAVLSLPIQSGLVCLGLVLCKSFIAHFAYFLVVACLTRLNIECTNNETGWKELGLE
jgi:hypothetical protein